jgi:hypothetical protein
MINFLLFYWPPLLASWFLLRDEVSAFYHILCSSYLQYNCCVKTDACVWFSGLSWCHIVHAQWACSHCVCVRPWQERRQGEVRVSIAIMYVCRTRQWANFLCVFLHHSMKWHAVLIILPKKDWNTVFQCTSIFTAHRDLNRSAWHVSD